MLSNDVKKAIEEWHGDAHGVYVSVDGQYGSTGKGVLNAAIAEAIGDKFVGVISNAGPNSGHTSFIGNREIVLKQLPTFGVTIENTGGSPINVYLNGGAVIDLDVLRGESESWFSDKDRIHVHPNSSVITPDRREEDKTNVKGIASTGQGVGPAIMAKLKRTPEGVIGHIPHEFGNGVLSIKPSDVEFNSYFVEVSQGYSLGINSGFYPHVTSRECTVSQALADAGIPPFLCKGVAMSIRVNPIRVGSTENSSGPYYSDQTETTWEDSGLDKEYTTVTRRVRRVFSFSRLQLADALKANMPSLLFLNFCNHLPKDTDIYEFVEHNVKQVCVKTLGYTPTILLGFGPKGKDITVFKSRREQSNV